MRFSLLVSVLGLGLAWPALAADIPELPEKYRERYSRLLRLVVQRSEADGLTVEVELARDRVTIKRSHGTTPRDPVVLHLSEKDEPPYDLGELNYLVEHWRSLRFDQSISEVRFFDGRDERVVYGYASCHWKLPDGDRRICRDKRRQALLAALDGALKKLRKSKTLPAKPEKPPEDDAGRMIELIRAWCERSGLDRPLPEALRFFGQASAKIKGYSGAQERIRDSWSWVKPYLPAMREILKSRGVPEDLVYLSSAEAHFRPFLRSHAGAVGPWQFMPASGRERGLRVDRDLDQRRDMLRATEAAARFLSEQHRRLGDWGLAAISYNQGPTGALNAVMRGGTNSVPELIAKARAHGGRLKGKPFRVGAHYWPVLVAERQGFAALAAAEAAAGAQKPATADKPAATAPPTTAPTAAAEQPAAPPPAAAPSAAAPPPAVDLFHVPLNAAARITRLARTAGLPASELLAYNLALGPDRRHEVYAGLYHDKPLDTVLRSLPTRGVQAPAGYVLTLPGANLERFIAAYLPAAYGGKQKRVRVRKGDTLWKLARDHGTAVEQLAALNGLGREARLKAGASLLVPMPGKVGETDLEHLLPLADLAHRAEAARLYGRWGEAARHYADLAAADTRGYLGRQARSQGVRMAQRLIRGLRYGLDGYPRDALQAASMIAEWREPSDGSAPLPDETGSLALAWARALIDAGDPWRARQVLSELAAQGKQTSAARALLRGLAPESLRRETIALRTLELVSLETLLAELNPDPTRFRLAMLRIPGLTACVRTGESIGLQGEERHSMIWPAEPWCGSLAVLGERVAASLGASHELDLEASSSLLYSVARGARIPLLPAEPTVPAAPDPPAPPTAPAGG